MIPNSAEAIRRLLARHADPGSVRVCYEAGPSGYDTHRTISSLGFPCDVIAPSLIPRRSGARVKTDRIDARNLARLHRAGELSYVRVPSTSEEAVRDLIRVREEVKADRRVALQRIRAFLLRYGKRYPGGSDRWSFRFEVWARALSFEEPCATEAFQHLLGAYFVRDAQLAEMGRRIEELAGCEPFAEPVALLRSLRGIDTLSAITIAAETCDFARFPEAGSYMAFTGLTHPSTPAGPVGTKARSPRRATATSAACSWRPPGRTGTCLLCAASSRSGSKACRRRSRRTRGRRSAGSPLQIPAHLGHHSRRSRTALRSIRAACADWLGCQWRW